MKKLTANINEVAEKLNTLDGRGDEQDNYVGFDISVEDAVWSLKAAMFPKFFGTERFGYDVGIKRQTELAKAYDEIQKCLRYVLDDEDVIREKAAGLINKLPEIMESVKTDIIAAYEGDPAAKSKEEVILTYPAFDAITIYRIPHELYVQGVPILPRKMTELAHQRTGIDIHPGATIGNYFFIDHGTGEALSARYLRRQVLRRGRRRYTCKGCEETSQHRKQRCHLCRSHHSGRRRIHRGQLCYRRFCMAHSFCA